MPCYLPSQEATSHMNLGAMLHVNGKLEEAEQSYLAALRIRPDEQVIIVPHPVQFT